MQNKERAMFGKSKDDNDQLPSPVQQPEQPAVAKSAEQGSTDQVSTISRGMTIVGKISGEGTLNVFGQVEGELRALNVLINEGARVEGDVVAQELTIARSRSKKMPASKDRRNARTMPSIWRAPAPSLRPPAMTFRLRSLPSRAAGNRTGRQAMRDPLTRHRSLTQATVRLGLMLPKSSPYLLLGSRTAIRVGFRRFAELP